MEKVLEVQKVDYNIEYAHIYTDKHFGVEQTKSIQKLQYIIHKLIHLNKTFVLTVLIDEYNPTNHELNIKDFLNKLRELNAEPDFVGYESRLVAYKDALLSEMNRKTKREYEKYIKEHQKLPCSFLITIWHLKRLGIISNEKKEVIHLIKNNKPFAARKIITILPKKYKDVERKAFKIIKATKFKSAIQNIKNIYY